jgi:hypothetical protein
MQTWQDFLPYDRPIAVMARHSFDEILSGGDAIPLKTYRYALRACFAPLWIRQFRTTPL